MQPLTESVTKLPKNFKKGTAMKPRGYQKVNPIAAVRDNEHHHKQLAAHKAANAGATKKNASADAPKCRSCKGTVFVQTDRGNTCNGCGRVIDDSNIVSEVSFGETANGAAVVQGQYLNADQGAARISGGPRRQAGHGSGEARDKSIREAKTMMLGFAHQVEVSEHVALTGHQYFKLASGLNFVQGRKFQNVVAVCLYASCRSQDRCKVMLIDLAEIVKEDVFALGRTFKALCNIPGVSIKPIFVEDLIYRFAARCELGELTNKVAEIAVRLVQRMDRDWMVMGRRPSSICAAALHLACQMFNFRRISLELSYITKITTATINERLAEFAETETAKMTIEEFLSRDFIASEHDPPALYKKTPEYIEKVKARRALKRKGPSDDEPQEEATLANDEPATPSPAPAQGSDKVNPSTPPTSQPRIDKDGFAIPATPQKHLRKEDQDVLAAVGMLEQGMIADDNDQLNALASAFGETADAPDINDDEVDIVDTATADKSINAPPATNRPDPEAGQHPRKKRRGDQGGSLGRPELAVATVNEAQPETGARREPGPETGNPDLSYRTEEWEADENEIHKEIREAQKDITEAINDPTDPLHEFVHVEARKRVEGIMEEHEKSLAGRKSQVSDDVHIGEDEFADDPEIEAMIITDEDERELHALRWINENKSWLLAQQAKEFKAKLAAKNPAKVRKPRAKKPRMGEGQKEPAASAAEAVEGTIKARSFKINYQAMTEMFDNCGASRPGSVASGTTSRATSVAPSEGPGTPRTKTFGQLRFMEREQEDEADEDPDIGGEEEQTFEEDIDPFADEDGGNNEDE